MKDRLVKLVAAARDRFVMEMFAWVWRKRFRRHPDWVLKWVHGWNSCVIDDKYGQRMRVWF